MRKWNSTGLHLHLQILLVLALSYCKILCLYSLCSLVTQSCPTLCDPMDCRLPGSSFHGILQARVLEWVAISFSRGYSQPRDWTQVSHIAGRGFTLWATKEAYLHTRQSINSILSLAIMNPFPNLWPGEKEQGRKLFSGLNWNLLHFLVLDKSKFHSHYHIIFIISIISKTCPPPPPPPPKNNACKVIHYSKQYIIRDQS